MQRYFAKDGDEIKLNDSDIHHIKNVMRMKVNDLIEVVYNNKLYICKISSFEPFMISIDKVINEENKLDLDIVMAIPLVKEQKMDLILQKLTELGVNTIIPINTERSIVKLDGNRLDKKRDRWQSICKEASEQSKRTNIPIVEEVMCIKDLVKISGDIRLVASTREKCKMFNYYLQERNKCAKIIMVFGPEGGLSEKEESYLCENGYDSVSFGNLIFRIETACIYAASILNYYSSMR